MGHPENRLSPMVAASQHPVMPPSKEGTNAIEWPASHIYRSLVVAAPFRVGAANVRELGRHP